MGANMLTITEQLIHNTIRIESFFKDKVGTGTGCFFVFKIDDKQVPVIVTNKHVVKDPGLGYADKGKLIFKLMDEKKEWIAQSKFEFNIANFGKSWIMHPDDKVDLCIFPLGGIIEQMRKQDKKPFYILIDENMVPSKADEENFGAMEEIVMVGYPNGIWDQLNNLPILRKGITATHPSYNYNGKNEFLIDAACFPGSSGSPVFLLNLNGYSDKKGTTYMGAIRVKFLGILYAGPQHKIDGEVKIVDVPIAQKEISQILIPNNLGNVIKAKELQGFKEILIKLISQQTTQEKVMPIQTV